MQDGTTSKLSKVERRFVRSRACIATTPHDAHPIAYQHTVFCQTSLPYRNPPRSQRVWETQQGKVAVRVEAGAIRNPTTNTFAEVGLPFGPKPRLILMHLNTEAVRRQSAEVDVQRSMTAFATRVLGYAPNGKEFQKMKTQLACLGAATVRLAIDETDVESDHINMHIVTRLNLWFPKDDTHRVLWPQTLRLSDEYFHSLVTYAVPLNEHAISALSHSAMGLDIYAWLAQRLHRIDSRRPQCITWKAIKDQFGRNYKRMNHFRAEFLPALGQVLTQYPEADVDISARGIMLHASPPPIAKRLYPVPYLPR